MSKSRMFAALAAALVVGLVAGNVVSGIAAPAPETTATTEAASPLAGLGLRMGATMRDAGGRMVDVLAKLTGLSTDEIHDQRADGRTIADIAEAEGVDSDQVVSDTLAIRKQLLDDAVAEGTITQDQADATYDRMSTRINDRVTSTEMGGRGMGGGRGRGGMGGGCGAGGAGGTGGTGACGGTCTTAPVTQ